MYSLRSMGSADARFSWDDLLVTIADQRVIPIVGRDLLCIESNDGEQVLLDQRLAETLARLLGLPGVPPGPDLVDAVVREYLRGGGDRSTVYSRMRSATKELAPFVPVPLRQLARIADFKLFISTTSDSLLEQAINAERFAGTPGVQSFKYSPNNAQDLPCDFDQLSRPTVYHLLGKVSAVPDYVVTEEDRLEFLHALQSVDKRPKLLFDALKANHLLLIGTRFPDWLTRFFLRLAKGDRLYLDRACAETLVSRDGDRDSNLKEFLRTYSRPTRIFAESGPIEFVAELSRRYHEQQAGAPTAPAADSVASEEMPAGAVFLSYAHEDRPAVQAIHDALQRAGVDVWFDARKLQAGDDWEHTIKQRIRNCSLFLPVISNRTNARLEGVFREEWNVALRRAQRIDKSVTFIIPVAIDDIDSSEARVPEEFRALHWTQVNPAATDQAFVQTIVQRVREARKAQLRE
ncbi:MAG: toll/interleukin-1 receptor domain-containing protein [Tepidisphaerales bacterium]